MWMGYAVLVNEFRFFFTSLYVNFVKYIVRFANRLKRLPLRNFKNANRKNRIFYFLFKTRVRLRENTRNWNIFNNL